MLKWFKKKDDASAEAPSGATGSGVASDASTEAPAPGGDDDGASSVEGGSKGFFGRLREGLARTQKVLAESIRVTTGIGGRVDEEMLENLEEGLLRADVGSKAAERIVKRVREEGLRFENPTRRQIVDLVKEAMVEILEKGERELDVEDPPAVLLFVGVNGTGKTTTIGKLALEFGNEGRKVVLAAADTFRAAAVGQLEIWAKRSGAGFVRKEEGSDPASVAFEAMECARRDDPDVVMIDTAGRLHTKRHLMDELEKIVRVIQKVDPHAPREIILVVDATTGQNALNQVRTFRDCAELSGIVMTKLDGTAKGGVLLAIKEEFELPVFRIGVGEAPEDLRPFEPWEFVNALLPDEDDEDGRGIGGGLV